MNKTITISTANGGEKMANREHNVRNPKIVKNQEHIEPRPSEGKICEIWQDESPAKAYKRIFGKALKKYNEKQTRNDRKIRSYYQHELKDPHKNAVYEMIVSVGNHANRVSPEDSREILRKYFEEWRTRNRNLELIGAYYHADEKGVPHLHIDYVPVCYENKRGMDIQNSLTGALKAMGYETVSSKNTAQMQWQKSENKYLESLCREKDYDVAHPQAGKKDIHHLETEVYKLQAQLEEAKKENERIQKLIKEVVEQDVDELGKTTVFGDFKCKKDTVKALKAEANKGKDAEERARTMDGSLDDIRRQMLQKEVLIKNKHTGKSRIARAMSDISFENVLEYIQKKFVAAEAVEKRLRKENAELIEKKRELEAEIKKLRPEPELREMEAFKDDIENLFWE